MSRELALMALIDLVYHSNFFVVCSAPKVTLIPDKTSLSSPAQFRRIQDFFISSTIVLDCSVSLAIQTQWSIINCTSTCSNIIQYSSSQIITTTSELYVPARILDFGRYQLKLTVTMIAMPQFTTSVSAYIGINPTGITANLVPLGTSIISSGRDKDLTLDPGSYSVDPDAFSFNASVSNQDEKHR